MAAADLDELTSIDLITGITSRLDETDKISNRQYKVIINAVKVLGYNNQADLIEIFYKENNFGQVIETIKTVIRFYHEDKLKEKK